MFFLAFLVISFVIEDIFEINEVMKCKCQDSRGSILKTKLYKG